MSTNRKIINDETIIKLMREERQKQLDEIKKNISSTLNEELDIQTKVDGVNKTIISPGLKIKSAKEGKLFTVKSLSTDSAVLTDPNGKDKQVTMKELENEFNLD